MKTPKVHMYHGIGLRAGNPYARMKCGRHVCDSLGRIVVAYRWDKVTCKGCLATKPKRQGTR